MRKITPEEAAELKLPTHEHHDLPANQIVLNAIETNPGSWFHVAWEELGGIGGHGLKRDALRRDAEFRRWTLHDHVIPGGKDGGLYLMRDCLE